MNTTITLRTVTLSASAGLVATLLGGCQAFQPASTAQFAPEPPANATFVGTDQPVRDWDQSVALIQNGDATTGSVGMRYRTKEMEPYYVPAAEVGVFVANLVTMPYTLLNERGTQVSGGVQIPPTHTAMPALPPEPAPQPSDVTPPEEPTPDEPMPDAPMPPADETVVPVPPALEPTSTQPGAPEFTIGGQVIRPGAFSAEGEKRLSAVIAAAEPASEDPAKVRVTITRAGEEPATTTLAALLAGDVEDIVIRANDTIIVDILP